MKKQLTLVQSLLWIVLSSVIVSGSAYSGIRYYFGWQRQKAQDPNYRIISIVQTGPQREALKTDYLAQRMGVSFDQPTSSLRFNVKRASRALLGSPVIKEAHVKIMAKDTLYVDYTVRQPVAWLYDYTNTAIDEEGVIFPVSPFFTPKKLPEIYIGLLPFGTPSNNPDIPMGQWHLPLQGRRVALALTLLKLISEPAYAENFHVRRIDVSHAFAASYGSREIVLITEDSISKQENGREVQFIFPRLLRLSPKNYAQELANFVQLREKMLLQEAKELTLPPAGEIVQMKEKVIDFRLPHLAFIDKGKLER